MTYLLSTHWALLLFVFVFGNRGRSVGRGPAGLGTGGFERGRWGLVIAFIIGCLLAVIRAFTNEVGYGFDVIMLAIAVYLIGCVLGGLFSARRTGVAAPGLALAAPPVPRACGRKSSGSASSRPGSCARTGSNRRLPEAEARAGTGATLRPEVERVGFKPAWELRKDGIEPPVDPPKPPSGPASIRPEVERVNFAPEWELRKRAEREEVATPPPVAPAPAAPAVAADDDDPSIVAERPTGIAGPRWRQARNNLQRIRGIGKVNEAKLNELGVWHFDQVAAWTAPQAKWVNSFPVVSRRIQREDWIGQARVLATGADTAFSKRVDAGEVANLRQQEAVGLIPRFDRGAERSSPTGARFRPGAPA